MQRSSLNEAKFYGYAFAIVGIFSYGIYKFIPAFFIQAICAICLLMAIFNLSRAYFITLANKEAVKKHEEFKKIKKQMTEEYKEAKIVGLTTPGLVAKQSYIPLENGDGILLTSGIFHLSSEKTLWKKGVEPDIKITEKNPDLTSYLKKSLSY